jgi:hypothetical protein
MIALIAIERKVTMKSKSKLREDIACVISEIDSSYWEAGELLLQVRDRKYYKAWGYKTFRSYVEYEIKFSVRTVEYWIRLYKWKNGLSKDAQKWAVSERWGVLSIVYNGIDESNWKDWREVISGKTRRQVLEIWKEFRVGDDFEVIDRMRRARAQAKVKSSGNGFSEVACAYRLSGLTSCETADELGVDEKDIKSCIRFISSFIPRDVYERIQFFADQNKCTVSEEIASVLGSVYVEEEEVKIA